MNNTKEKFREAFDCLLSKDDIKAKAIIKEAISQHPKMKKYKDQLREMGMDFKTETVDDKIYEDIENVLNEYDRELQLKILDHAYLKIANNK